MYRTPTLNEAWGTSSFFAAWGEVEGFPLPWYGVEGIPQVPLENLDILLFSEFGKRPVSPLVLRYYNPISGEWAVNGKSTIAHYVQTILQKQMERYVAAYAAEYNPATNYDVTETHTGTDTDEQTFDNYHEKTEYSHTVQTHDNIYGFDSDSGVNDSESTVKYMQDAGETGDTRTMDGTRTDETTYNSELHKVGNIGVQTVPDMLQKDFSLWGENNLWFKIAADVAAMLTVPIYE